MEAVAEIMIRKGLRYYTMDYKKGPLMYSVEKPETLEDRMNHLAEMKQEYANNRKAFKEKNKHLVESIKTLENIISDEVLKLGKTVTVGNIRVEYVPTIKIKMKKEVNND